MTPEEAVAQIASLTKVTSTSLRNMALATEVALGLVGTLGEIVGELAADAERADLLERLSAAYSLAGDVLRQEP